MKTKILSICLMLLLCAKTGKCQITLLHTVSEFWYSTTIDNQLFYFFEHKHVGQQEIKIYNQDFSLYAHIELDIPDTCSWNAFYSIYNQYSGRGLLSRHLFNNDQKLEYCYYVEPINYLNKKSRLYVINEDGTIVHSFGEIEGLFSDGGIDVLSNGSCRLRVNYVGETHHDNSTYIYSLPGNVSSIATATQTLFGKPAYPNPSTTTVSLPYQLSENEQSTMQIFNSTGQLMEEKTIDGTFDQIQLNISNYPSGIYVYTYNKVSRKFVVRR